MPSSDWRAGISILMWLKSCFERDSSIDSNDMARLNSACYIKISLAAASKFFRIEIIVMCRAVISHGSVGDALSYFHLTNQSDRPSEKINPSPSWIAGCLGRLTEPCTRVPDLHFALQQPVYAISTDQQRR